MKRRSCVATFFVSISVSLIMLCGVPAVLSHGAALPRAHPAAQPADGPSPTFPVSVAIPGPLRSFLRMAAISQKVSPDQVVPLLARNVAMEGYGWRGRTPEPTEYLTLLKGYLKHARALRALAGPQGTIRVSSCQEAQPLLEILGYRLGHGCGPDTFVQTAEPKSAFLTIDSGFPLEDLVDSLRDGKPFVYSFPNSEVPVLFGPKDWTTTAKQSKKKVKPGQVHDVIDSLVGDPALARLYWAMARMDSSTRLYLQQSPGLKKLMPFASVLNFYGSDIYIRNSHVVVPGGARAESGWRRLVGASPKSPAAFVMHLVAKDDGWAAAYFDALSRVSGAQQAYFTESHRLRHNYAALRGQSALPGPARPVFRPDPGLLLLVTRLQLDSTGQPRIPGGLAVWKEIVSRDVKSHSKIVRLWAGRAREWKNPDQFVAALFAISRVQSENSPLHLFLVLNEIDRRRSAAQPLSTQTVRLLAENFSQFGDQYPLFSEFQALDGASIARFVSVADSLDRIRDHAVRSDAIGIMQADTGLWEILARQGEIPTRDWNHSWQAMLSPFASVRTSTHVFDAARSSLRALLRASSGTPGISEDEIINLLAGPDQTSQEGRDVRGKVADRIRSALEAQRLVSLDTLFSLGAGLRQMAQGRPAPQGLLQLAGELREFRMPKPLFSSGERAEWSYGLYSNPHIQGELSVHLDRIIKAPRSRRQLAAARALLVPFLRDTLVGLNYAYYQPPGAQVLYNDPFFVRSHDFSGQAIMGRDQSWKTPTILGRGWAASGGAHLVGSLADLPYVLAEVEQDFIVPQNVQALIWEDLVPTLLTNAVVPRWWHVTPAELHAVTLYQQFSQQVLATAAKDSAVRRNVMSILSGLLLPEKASEVESAVRAGRPDAAFTLLTAAQSFYLAGEFRQEFPRANDAGGTAGQQLDQLARRFPGEVTWARLSDDFGVPHPALAQTYACSLIRVKPFPTFLGYSSRLLAESWQSNNLYWAEIADKLGYPPVMLNLLVPELTRRMVANIFATDLQDRPALARALRQTGEEFRQGLMASLPKRPVGSGS